MPSMIYVRHVCDRCAEMQEIEVHQHAETPAKPEGWLYVVVGDETSMLCTKCVEGLHNWIGVRPPELKVVK